MTSPMRPTGNLLYKLTRNNLTTYRDYRYVVGEWTQEHSGEGNLCGSGWVHAYLSPQLALLLDPIHANFGTDLRLWRAEGVIGTREGMLKVGTRRLRLIEELPVPVITPEQRVTFVLWCVLAVYHDPAFVVWAEAWLGGTDRSAVRAGAGAAGAWAAAGAARAAEAAPQQLNLMSLAHAALLPWEP